MVLLALLLAHYAILYSLPYKIVQCRRLISFAVPKLKLHQCVDMPIYL